MQRSLPNQRYEVFSGSRGVLMCECIYNPAWVTLDKEGDNPAKFQVKSHLTKLQVSHKEVEGKS